MGIGFIRQPILMEADELDDTSSEAEQEPLEKPAKQYANESPT
jgi:hypothetical protein